MQTEEDELQKAIDDITGKSASNAVESITDFAPPTPPTPENPGMPEDMPDPMSMAPSGMDTQETPTPTPIPAPTSAPTSASAVSDMGFAPESRTMVANNQEEKKEPEENLPVQTEQAMAGSDMGGDSGLEDIKKQALQDLFPLLDKMNIMPEQKYRIYVDMFETMKDSSALKSALEAAKQISDDAKRGEALLSIVEMIDNK